MADKNMEQVMEKAQVLIEALPYIQKFSGKTVVINGVTIIGNSNLAASLPASASPLYAKNILNFLDTMYNKEEKSLNYNFEDELIKGTCLCYNGKMIHPSFTGA